MNKNAVITELFAIRKDLHEKALSAKTPEERMHYALLKHACESDILDMANNSDKWNRSMPRQAQTGELCSPHLLLGDCAEQMRDLAPSSIDAIVTDPPYGLNFMGMDFDNPKMMGQSPVMYGGLQRYNKGEKRTGYADCDNVKFQSYLTPIFAEALRVVKPGAYLLAFGGTRTYHRLACAIEDAGWEIRDCIMWVYGSGFPKSMDVSKAIDKMKGAKREKIQGVFGKTSFGLINDDSWESHKDIDSNIPATPEAAAWQGWGTCLKPAVEPIVVARKPLDGTVAANVLKYGTGAINIDACRVPVRADDDVFAKNPHTRSLGTEAYNHNCYGKYKPMACDYDPSVGRFPANLIHDGSSEVLALFPESNGGAFPSHSNVPTGKFYGGGWGNVDNRARREMGVGSAARFFYCAKASRKERDGSDHPTMKPLALMRYLVRLVARKGGTVLDPFMGSGTTGVAAIQEGMQFIGIERDPHYYEIATRRVSAAKPEPPPPTQQELPL